MQGILISGELVPNEHRFLALGFCFLLLGPMFAVAPGLGEWQIPARPVQLVLTQGSAS